MAFRLRRGTDLQRQSITPAEGELIYVTDTKEIYAGDGTTLGGILVTGDIAGSPPALTRDLDTDGFTISGNGTIDLSGTITATSFVGDGSGLTGISSGGGAGIIEGYTYTINIEGDVLGTDSSTIVDASTNSFYGNFIGDGSQITDMNLNQLDDVATFSPGEGEILKYIGGFWTNAPDGDAGAGLIQGQCYPISIQGDIVSQDSSVIVDATNNIFTGDLIGNVLGNLTGDVDGNVVGDLVGSVFADDSTPIVDAINKTLNGNLAGDAFGNHSGTFTGDMTGDLIGNVTGNLSGNVIGNVSGDVIGNVFGTVFGGVDGELTGSVFTNNSTLVIDGDTGVVYPDSIGSPGLLNINTTPSTVNILALNSTDEEPQYKLVRKSSSDLSSADVSHGRVIFSRQDSVGTRFVSSILAYRTATYYTQDVAGIFAGETAFTHSGNTFTFGSYTPSSIKGVTIKDGSLVLDDSRVYTSITPSTAGEIMFDGITGDGDLYMYTGAQWTKIVKEGLTSGATILSTPLLLGGVDNATIDAFGEDSSSIDGALLYNTDDNRMQVFQAGSWVSLPNNGTAIGEVLRWNGTEWAASVDPASGTTSNSDALGGQTPEFYLDYTNFTNTPTISAFGATLIDDADAATARTTLGLGTAATTAATAYATSAQGATADTALQPADLGNFTFTSSVLDTSDSSGITVTPAVVMSSDLTVENNLTVTNKIVVDTIEVNNLITAPGAGTPEIESDGAILLTAGTRVEISSSPLKMASFTTAERDGLSAENGDMIYNTTTNKFQGYANSTWVDLH
jgi:hypothetical protein